jgi:MbtH protein
MTTQDDVGAAPPQDDEDDPFEKLPHIVLINHEEQFSLWRADIEIPDGWREVWGPDTKDACMKWVDEVWTDLRPLSLRKLMDAEKKRAESEHKGD